MMGTSMATESFFEGPEKKLELVVSPGFPSLRALGHGVWERVVGAAGARVISVLQTERCDAFLLSESSLFVFEDWFVMITCGQTTLVDAVPEILRVIPEEVIELLVYERKSEHFPEHQPTTFAEDARRLEGMLPGRTLCFGDPHGRCIQLFHTTRPYVPKRNDPTLEVLMHVIDEDVAKQFAPARLPEEGSLAQCSGLDEILPGFTTSEHVFKPAGYSLNGVKGEEFYTCHVTPEETGSYVSFETNYDFRGQLDGLVESIVDLFRPRSFELVTFLPKTRPEVTVGGYRLGERVVHTVNGYQVSYFQYSISPSGPASSKELAL